MTGKRPVTTTMTEQEEYANAGITKEQAEKTVEESTDDPWVEDEDGNFVRKSETKKTRKKKK